MNSSGSQSPSAALEPSPPRPDSMPPRPAGQGRVRNDSTPVSCLNAPALFSRPPPYPSFPSPGRRECGGRGPGVRAQEGERRRHPSLAEQLRHPYRAPTCSTGEAGVCRVRLTSCSRLGFGRLSDISRRISISMSEEVALRNIKIPVKIREDCPLPPECLPTSCLSPNVP
jgi:hypothetical protein